MSTTLSDHQDTNLERILLITNLVVELPSAVFDQLSSVHKPRYALISMIMSLIILLISVLDFVRMGRRQRVKWMKRDKIIPWFYSQDPSFKPLGTFADVVGLVCSIFQCVSAAVAYEFLSHKSDNPIKISVWPLIFAFGVLLTRFPRNHRSEIHPENPARSNLRELQDSETSLYYGDKKKDRKYSEKIKKAKRKKREELARLKELHTLKGQVESVAELRELEIDSDEQFLGNPPPKSALERLESAQTSQQGLQSPNYSSPSSETSLLFQDKNSYRELSEMAEEVKRRAETARLKGHVESVVRLKGLDIDQQ